MRALALAVFSLALVSSCGAGEGGTDAGQPTRLDAGRTADAGVVKNDAGLATDGGPGDAGASDAGAPADAGPLYDGTCLRTPQWNTVPNASFECDLPQPWLALSGSRQLVTGENGGRALEAHAGVDGRASVGLNDVVADSNGVTYCARLKARGTAPQFRFEIRESPSGLGTAFSGPLDGGEWLRIPPVGVVKFSAQRENSLSLLMGSLNGVNGSTVAIDDVELWPSPSGACDEH